MKAIRKCYAKICQVDVYISFSSTDQRQLAGEYIEDEGYSLIAVNKSEIPRDKPITHFHLVRRERLRDLIIEAM